MPVRVAEGPKPFVLSKNNGFGMEITGRAHIRRARTALTGHFGRWTLQKNSPANDAEGLFGQRTAHHPLKEERPRKAGVSVFGQR